MEELEAYKWFINQSPIIQALLAGLFTWGLTAIGAALVFLFKSSNRKVLDMCLGFLTFHIHIMIFYYCNNTFSFSFKI